MNFDARGVPDFSVPSAARMYDYFLGGKDHFHADREAAERIIAAYPETRILARANRRFLTRAVWYLAEHGIRQYVDLGCGMPTPPAVHEIARQVRPGARVVYVDSDPVVASHCRSVCHGDEGLAFVEGDIRAPLDILSHWQLARTIDLAAPVAFLCAAVLHFVPGEDEPEDIAAALRWRMAPGSYLVISHAVTDDASKDVLSTIADVYEGAAVPAVPRTAEDIGGFLTGLDLVEPGLVDVSQWRPDEQEETTRIRFLAGVGRKPRDLPHRTAEMPRFSSHSARWQPSRRKKAQMLADVLIVWVVLGVTFDLIFLYACRLMRTGKLGEVLRVNYYRAQRPVSERAAVIGAAVIGLLFPPYMLAALVRLCFRVRQEQARLREYGRG